MNIIRKAKEKLEDGAGGARGTREEAGDHQAAGQADEARFDPEEVRGRSKPKDNLPMPEDFEAGSKR